MGRRMQRLDLPRPKDATVAQFSLARVVASAVTLSRGYPERLYWLGLRTAR